MFDAILLVNLNKEAILRKVICLFFYLLIGSIMLDCFQNNSESIADYFPMKQGMEWHYEIEIGQKIPSISRTVLWPTGDGKTMMVETSARYFRSIKGRTGKKYKLVLKIVGKIPKDMPMDYKRGVKLKVEKDELGVYSKGSVPLWIVPNASLFMVDEMVLLPVTSSHAPPGWHRRTTEKFGFYFQTILFKEKEGSRVNHGDRSPAKLQFVGKKNDRLLFVRSFGSTSKIELLWFKKGKGLISLEQMIDKKVSMTWKLVKLVFK